MQSLSTLTSTIIIILLFIYLNILGLFLNEILTQKNNNDFIAICIDYYTYTVFISVIICWLLYIINISLSTRLDFILDP